MKHHNNNFVKMTKYKVYYTLISVFFQPGQRGDFGAVVAIPVEEASGKGLEPVEVEQTALERNETLKAATNSYVLVSVQLSTYNIDTNTIHACDLTHIHVPS